MTEPLHIISLGAGVQSSTMALMAAHGEIEPMPDAAIFADTGAEPYYVYTWLETLKASLPFPVYTVQHGDLGAAMLNGYNPVPTFKPPKGMGRRQCTREYKIAPIHKKARELAGLKPGQRSKDVRVIMWQGISTDEIQRARGAPEKWLDHLYPLINHGMSREDCKRWFLDQGWASPPRRSACVFCPYQSADWAAMKINEPLVWEQALVWDRRLRERGEFLHWSMQPLEQAVELGTQQIDMWDEECEGMCGL